MSRQRARNGQRFAVPAATADVIFALLPYVALERPSVALGTLTACLEREGIRARTVHANILFAERIGVPAYEGINNSDITLQIGEWTFSEAAFPEHDLGAEAYVDRLAGELGRGPTLKNELFDLRSIATRFIDELAERILEARPRIVGCSSVFQQHCASLALLRRLRQLDPSVVTMLGGANCEGSMGAATHQAFDWVDYVVSGEADRLLPDLCRLAFEHGREVAVERLPYGVFGPRHRLEPSSFAKPPRVLIQQLDELPVPSYDDYFEQLRRSTIRDFILPALSLETSRGCWWGAKSHCTFCGLNGVGMTYRSKSRERVLEEVEQLARRHGIDKFMVVDNILDNSYFHTVLPTLSEAGDKHFFYETKANLKRAQVDQLARAGVRWIQPGIEALSDELLSLIRKGTTACQNVQLLKWARGHGVWIIWNHLYGAPGDRLEWYDEVADWLPLISHLQPPTNYSLTRIRIDRFSPYFLDPAGYGLELRPYWSYAHAYPLDGRGLRDQAYFFTDTAGDGTRSVPEPPRRLAEAMREWATLFYQCESGKLPAKSPTAPELSVADDGERLCIRDTRPCAVAAELDLGGLDARVYRTLDAAKSPESVIRGAQRSGGASEREVVAAVDRLVELKLVAVISGRLLSLGIDEPAVPYLHFAEFPGLTLMAKPRHRSPPPPPPNDPWNVPLAEVFQC